MHGLDVLVPKFQTCKHTNYDFSTQIPNTPTHVFPAISPPKLFSRYLIKHTGVIFRNPSISLKQCSFMCLIIFGGIAWFASYPHGRGIMKVESCCIIEMFIPFHIIARHKLRSRQSLATLYCTWQNFSSALPSRSDIFDCICEILVIPIVIK